MNRRMFLRGVGGAILAAPFLGSIGHRRGVAQEATPPKRLVIFFTPNGVNMDEFFPSISSGQLNAGALAGRGLEPLSSFADQLLVPRGIHMSPRGFGIDGIQGCDHRKGMACKLTAVPTINDDKNFASGHSVDFEAARRINLDGRDPLVLQVGRRVDPSAGDALTYCSYSGPGSPYPGENNPWNVYRGLMGISTGGEADDLITRRRQSIADLVRDDLDALRRLPMSRTDEQRIDAWLQLVRDTEMGMVATCGPDTPERLGITGIERYDGMSNNEVGSDSEFGAVGRLHQQLIALTMICDVNRVATLQWSRGSGGPTFRWDGINHEFTHHQLSHRNGRDSGDEPDIPGIERQISDVDRWYASRFNELVTLFDMFDENQGTMLDNSVLMWINELSDGKAHHFNNMPIVIAGTAGGYLRTGQVVDCSARGDFGSIDGAPHNKLLTTLLNAVGARADNGGPIESFGSVEHGQPGEFNQLKA